MAAVDLSAQASLAVPACEDISLPISRIDFAEFSRDLLRNFRRLHELHGPIAAIEQAGQRVVLLFSPEYNQQVLSDTERFHARFFTIRGPRISAQRRCTSGLLAMNGEQHRRNRRIVKEPFSLRSISNYGDTIVRLTDELLATWQTGEVRDMAEEMRQYMLRVTSTILFGMDDPEAACRLGDMIARWVSLNHRVGVGALVPNEQFTEGYEQLLRFAEELEAGVMSMIHQRRKSRGQGDDVLSILVRSHDKEGGLSDEELVGQTAVLFGAAHMTTAHSLTWMLLLLAQYPSVMRKLWHELNDVNTTDGSAPKAIGSLPKGEDLSLLDRVIKEGMRLLPASAYSQRICSVGVRLGPFDLPRGTGIVFTPIITHHLADLYSQPERFEPDRWCTLRPSPYAYHPFGAGPRLCIGAPLATAVIRIALQRILTSYRLSAVAGSEINAHIESTMLFPMHGVPMEIHPADGNFAARPIIGNIHELVDFDEIPGAAGKASNTAKEGALRSVAPRRPR